MAAGNAHADQAAMKQRALIVWPVGHGCGGTMLIVFAALLLAACGNNPPQPDWQIDAGSALESFEQSWLTGHTQTAEMSYRRARAAVSATGDARWMARVELVYCATRVSAAEFDCTAQTPTDTDATLTAYSRFIRGDWQNLESGSLPQAYRAVLSQPALDLRQIEAPLSRLIAAGVLFKRGVLSPAQLNAAIDTASAQGWRRPLLAWLGVALKRHETSVLPADLAAAAALRQRIALVEGKGK